MHKQNKVNKIYDPACGSGSLLLQAQKHFDAHIIEEGFFGQEVNHTTYNLARMNMFLHNINYDKFNIKLGNTLIDPHFGDDKLFDAIVSNPPYSVKWIGSDAPTLINDDRFAPAGVLAPKSKADFAFYLVTTLLRGNAYAESQVAYGISSISTGMHSHRGRWERAQRVVAQIADTLVLEYGKGFEVKNLHRMMKFAGIFPDIEIVAPLVRQLSWSHFLYLVPTLLRGNAYAESQVAYSISSISTGMHSHRGRWERAHPVKRGYVDKAEHWRYSSARDYLFSYQSHF